MTSDVHSKRPAAEAMRSKNSRTLKDRVLRWMDAVTPVRRSRTGIAVVCRCSDGRGGRPVTRTAVVGGPKDLPVLEFFSWRHLALVVPPESADSRSNPSPTAVAPSLFLVRDVQL